MSGYYPNQGQRPTEYEMDEEEMARQYYASMGYNMESPPMMPQYPGMMSVPTTAGFVPAEAGYHASTSPGRHYQNPYAERMVPHPAGPPSMQDYHAHQIITSSPPSAYQGYLPEAYQQSVTSHEESGMGMMHHHHHSHRNPSYDAAMVQQQQQQPPSPSSDTNDLEDYGILNPTDGTWRCKYPGCTSKSVFTRACDLRKHFNRHKKYLFCRFDGCPQATEGGFSSKKDRARHEAKHNPQIPCEWPGCDRVFSRMDNMKDHVRRIHSRGSR